jgi:hypothetical protein
MQNDSNEACFEIEGPGQNSNRLCRNIGAKVKVGENHCSLDNKSNSW